MAYYGLGERSIMRKPIYKYGNVNIITFSYTELHREVTE